MFRSLHAVALTLSAALLVITPRSLFAQSNVTVTYSASKTTAAAADLNAGSTYVGFATVRIASCNRNTCRVTMSAPTVPTNLRWVQALTNGQAPLLSACTNQVLPGGSVVLTATTFPATQNIYFCYINLTWTTAVTSFTPSLTFTLRQSN